MASRNAPRAAPSYDWDDDGKTSKQGSGIFILQPSVTAVVKKPSWFGSTTIFRPFPCVSFSNPTTSFEPYRLLQDGRNRFSDWIRRYACAWNVGTPATTYIIPKKDKFYDPWTSPLGILCRAIDNACKNGHPNTAEWQPLRERSANKSKALHGPAELYLMQGAVLEHDKKEYTGQNGPPLGWGKHPTLVLMCSADTGENLTAQLNAEHEGYKGNPADFELRYVNGDPVSPLSGRYVKFWERGSQNRSSQNGEPQKAATSFDEGYNDSTQRNRQGQPSFVPKGFDLELLQKHKDRPASFSKAGEQEIRNHWQHWDDILCLPDDKEQAHLLFNCFPPSACIYAFESISKSWLPEDAYKKANKAVSVAPGANYDKLPEPPPPEDGFGEAPAPFDDFGGASSVAPDNTVPSGVIDDSVNMEVPTGNAPLTGSTESVTTPQSNAQKTQEALAALARTRSKMS